jgi:hypothetical protein
VDSVVTFASFAKKVADCVEYPLLRTKRCPVTGLVALDPVEVIPQADKETKDA